MSNIKYNLSITLRKAIEPILRENHSLYKIEAKEGYLLILRDSNTDIDFHLAIIKETFDSNSHNVHFNIKPVDSNRIVVSNRACNLQIFAEELKKWFTNIDFYQQESILDDQFIIAYRKEFYDDFAILDEDAARAPFDRNQQLLLNRFLESCLTNIIEVEDGKNAEIINEIKLEIEELQSLLTVETKNGFMKKFSHIYAKAKKGGLKISEFLIKELGKEILKESVRIAFSFAANNSQEITKYLHL